jgi:hypothetical protein
MTSFGASLFRIVIEVPRAALLAIAPNPAARAFL